MLNPKLIKIKSDQLDIPYDNLLLGCLLEELMVFLSDNYKDEIWVVNDRSLGLKSYKHSMQDTLIIAVDTLEFESYLRKMSLMIVSYFMNLGIKVNVDFLSDKQILMHIHIDNMNVPIMLIITERGDTDTFPRDKSLRLTLENDKTIQYMQYPVEERAAALSYEILDKLELLSDMYKYIELYDILSTETIEGRYVKASLYRKCKDKSGFDRLRLDRLISYRDYTYMKKKYKRIKRSSKRSDLSWEEVHDLIISFIEPLYNAMLDDEMFFGDWIPDIARFLD